MESMSARRTPRPAVWAVIIVGSLAAALAVVTASRDPRDRRAPDRPSSELPSKTPRNPSEETIQRIPPGGPATQSPLVETDAAHMEIRGRVAFPPGVSSESAEVSVYSMDRPRVRLHTCVTAPDGSFLMTMARPSAPQVSPTQAGRIALQAVLATPGGNLMSNVSYVRSDRNSAGVLLLLRSACLVKARVVDRQGAAVPHAAVLVTQLPLSTFKSAFGSWEADRMKTEEFLIQGDKAGDVQAMVREGHVELRASVLARGPFGRPVRVLVQTGQTVDAGALEVATGAAGFTIRVRDEQGGVLEGIPLHFEDRSGATCGLPPGSAAAHARTDAHGCVRLELVSKDVLPMLFAAGSERFQVREGTLDWSHRSPQVFELVLERKPSRQLRIRDGRGERIGIPVQFHVELAQAAEGPGDTPMLSKPGRVIKTMFGDDAVVREASDDHLVVVAVPGAYRLDVLVSGGLRFSEVIQVDRLNSDRPLDIVLPDGRAARIQLMFPGGSESLEFAMGRVDVRWFANRAGEGHVLESTLSISRDLVSDVLWIPEDVVAADIVGAKRATPPWSPARVPVPSGSSVTIEVPVEVKGTGIVVLTTVLDGAPVGPVTLAVSDRGNASHSERTGMFFVDTGTAGVLRIRLPAGKYACMPFSPLGPHDWTGFECIEGAETEKRVELR